METQASASKHPQSKEKSSQMDVGHASLEFCIPQMMEWVYETSYRYTPPTDPTPVIICRFSWLDDQGFVVCWLTGCRLIVCLILEDSSKILSRVKIKTIFRASVKLYFCNDGVLRLLMGKVLVSFRVSVYHPPLLLPALSKPHLFICEN